MYNSILIRYSEIFLKKGRRKFFTDVLRDNLIRRLSDFEGISLKSPHGYFLLKNRSGDFEPDVLERITAELKKISGIASISPAVLSDCDMSDIAGKAINLLEKILNPSIAKFKIDASRSDKNYKFNSVDINRHTGKKIVDIFGLKVDLKNPDLTIYIHVAREGAYIYDRIIKGYGGLPCGTSGRVLLMLSGGIDSPVAGYLAMKRGCEVDAVYFHSFPYTKEGAKEKVINLCRILKQYQLKMRLFIVPFAAVQKMFLEKADRKYLVLLYRRSMMKITCILAEKYGYTAVVTGENLGQVASQTVENLSCIDDVSDRPVLRPLIFHDKMETVSMAREIGTFETSIIPYEDCCSLFVPKHPETKGRIENLEKIEKNMDLEGLIAVAMDQMEIMDI
jgi:thiamine biosynthesis protein ThiI